MPDRAPRRGGRWADHRRVLNGVFWRTRSGSPWRDLPSEYGHGKTVYNRHRRWSADGTWAGILDELRRTPTVPSPGWAAAGRWGSTPGWSARTSTRPERATPPRRMSPRRSSRRPSWTPGAPSNYRDRTRQPGRESLGRSRGGLTSKIHLAADARCRPIARITTAGHRHDSLAFAPLMAAIRIGRRGPGRPRTRPGQVRADKAYSTRAIRAYLRRHRIRAVIPEPADQTRNRAARGRGGGRPPVFDAETYRHRNTVEHAINKLEEPPRRRHPIRQTQRHLPRNHRRRLDPHLAPRPRPMIQGTVRCTKDLGQGLLEWRGSVHAGAASEVQPAVQG